MIDDQSDIAHLIFQLVRSVRISSRYPK